VRDPKIILSEDDRLPRDVEILFSSLGASEDYHRANVAAPRIIPIEEHVPRDIEIRYQQINVGELLMTRTTTKRQAMNFSSWNKLRAPSAKPRHLNTKSVTQRSNEVKDW
jgi:hypothetical protein